jgi:DNA polymerase-3 subunit gamma/tau
MSYLVLARKWRPGTFAEVVGQEHVTSTLQKAFEKERLAHAYLFSGPRGCGKTTTARLLAKVINCEDPKGGEPCNKCSSCVSVNEGTHLDMIEIDGASNRGIDEIRDLREKIGYSSSQSASKIYIIDEVHMLTQQAFNALLKTLEEPPGHVYLIFATTEPHKVPATILSRCQRFNFKRLELKELSGQLEKICAAEKIDFDTEALTLICRRADGSMRDAESLLDQCISAAEGKIDLETVRSVLGLVDSQIVSGLLDAVGRRDREAALAVVDEVTASGMDLEEFFIAFIEGIRNLLVISVSGERTDWLDLTSDEIAGLREIAGRFGVEDLLFLFRSMSRSYRELKGTSNPRYHIEAAVAEAASWESAVEIGELIGRLESGGGAGRGVSSAPASTRPAKGMSGKAPEKSAETGPKASEQAGAVPTAPAESVQAEAAPAPEASQPEAAQPEPTKTGTAGQESLESKPSVMPEPPVKANPLLRQLGGRDEWERFLAKVRESKLTVGIWLMSAEVAGVEDGKLILAFSSQNKFAMAMISQAKNKRLIEEQLEKFYGRKFAVETCELVDAGGRAPDRQAKMEMGVKTEPKPADSIREPSKEVSAKPDPEQPAASVKAPTEKPTGSEKKGTRRKKVSNPDLARIMDRLNAELLD